MKRFTLALLILLLSVPVGCGTGQSAPRDRKAEYASDVSTEDCYLCGGGIENLIPEYWGQNNVALISLNTFEIKPIGINRYDRANGQLIEEYAGIASFGGGGSKDGGFSANLMLDYDRGYAIGSIDLLDDETLDTAKAGSFLCAGCLNEILSKEIRPCFGVGVIHLDTKEICLIPENPGGFGLGDFYIDCHLIEQKNRNFFQMSILIFYCPIRYEQKS